MRAKLQTRFPGVTIIELFQHPTVGALATHLGEQATAPAARDGASDTGKRLAAGRQALMKRRRIRG